MNISTLFINNITQLDFGKLVNLKPSGDTYMVNIEISGPIEEKENVIVDFSNIKKTIKNLIDDKEYGFDHKLIISQNDLLRFNNYQIKNNYIEVRTDELFFRCPKNAIRFISKEVNKNNMKEELERYLMEELFKIYHIPLNVKIHLDSKAQNYFGSNYNENHFYFKYLHGLKNSSSWGCQNILHGHQSWLAFTDEDNNIFNTEYFFHLIYSFLKIKDCMFIWEDNVISQTNNQIELAYSTDRGCFELAFSSRFIDHFILKNETTIENLINWFAFDSEFSKDIQELKNKTNIRKLFLSEGLSKGSCVII